jgi:hypothetical protein
VRSDVATQENLVAVYHYGPTYSRAVCSCGWVGQRRFLRASASQDAWRHFAASGCRLASPLVVYFD